MPLDRIVADKRRQVAARKRLLSPPRTDRSLLAALRQGRTAFILECKKASPSRGLIRERFDPAAIADSYAPFADAISVLTDEPYFMGSFDHLRQVRERVTQPVLCKDFVVDPFQVLEARSHGADSILLMGSVLGQDELVACLGAARELGMEPLVEVHDESELERALSAGAAIIGINNRDLRTLRVDLSLTERLAPKVPADVVCVCESGIGDHRDVLRLRPHADAFLIGSSLMGQADLDAAVRAVVFGRMKICGLMHPEQAAAAWRAGATHGGLVLWPSSKRALSLARAREVCEAAPLGWVGVFVDQEPGEVARAARELSLAAVQLHGDEPPAYAERLRPSLPDGCAIWKAVRVAGDEVAASAKALGADRLLLDAFHPEAPGGTGTRFDWAVAARHPERAELVLSGGIDPRCADAASSVGAWALDLSSGVERAPGDKDPERMAQLFAALRGRGRT